MVKHPDDPIEYDGRHLNPDGAFKDSSGRNGFASRFSYERNTTANFQSFIKSFGCVWPGVSVPLGVLLVLSVYIQFYHE